MQKHEAHGSSRTKITTGGNGQLNALVGLIGNDAFAMSFQSVRQYREALLNAAPAEQGEPVDYPPTAECEKLRKDAERYRWLKLHLYIVDTYSGKGISYEVGIDGAEVPDIDDVTEAIDAAMQGANHDNQ